MFATLIWRASVRHRIGSEQSRASIMQSYHAADMAALSFVT